MKISVDVSTEKDEDLRADFVDDMEQMGFECLTEAIFSSNTMEFEASSFDAAELADTIYTYFAHNEYNELD
jgi:hypothetical protein